MSKKLSTKAGARCATDPRVVLTTRLGLAGSVGLFSASMAQDVALPRIGEALVATVAERDFECRHSRSCAAPPHHSNEPSVK
jgi:hypothetical protein